MNKLTRRDVLAKTGTVLVASHITSADAQSALNGYGYTDKFTYRPGETVKIYLNVAATHGDFLTAGYLYSGGVVNTIWELRRLSDYALIDSGTVSITPSVVQASDVDQNWPIAIQLPLSTSLKAGVYQIRLPSFSWQSACFFMVRKVIKAECLVIIPTNTMHAYTNFGGKSMYGYNSSNWTHTTKDGLQKSAP